MTQRQTLFIFERPRILFKKLELRLPYQIFPQVKLASTLSKESIEHLEKVFRSHLGKGREEFTIAEFKKIVPSKNPFFVERAFRIFDSDKNGTISISEFIETMHQFAGNTVDEKVLFLFKIYDLDDDGLLQGHSNSIDTCSSRICP